jgi:phage/plasmid-like protein (TIGR03299 family)
MAHNLAKNLDGSAKMAFAGETPWHRLGTHIDHVMNSEEAIKAASLDYEVGLNPVYMNVNDIEIPIPDKNCTYRKDINYPFSIVGSRYSVIQNLDAFKFIDDIIGRKEAIFETAGALFNGEKVFITCKLPSYIRLNGSNDIIENYLVLINDHTGSEPLYVLFTPVRVVCHNTVNAALRGAKGSNKYIIRHTPSSKLKLDFGSQLIGVYNTYAREIETSFNRMAEKKYDIRDFLKGLYLTAEQINMVNLNNGLLDSIEEISTQKKNLITDIETFYHKGIGQDMDTCKGTLYGCYQSVTGFFDNVQGYKSREDRMNSLIFGTSETKKQEAFNLAEKLVLS